MPMSNRIIRLCLRLALPIFIFAFIAAKFVSASEVDTSLEGLIAATPAGGTATIPAGNFTLQELTLPKSVSLVGAGYGKTFIKITGAGVHLKSSQHVTVSDLTLTGGLDATLSLEDCSDVAIRRVVLLKALAGVRAHDCSGLRIENAVLVDNRTGVSLLNCADCVIVNNTLFRNSAEALYLVGLKNGAVFNNLLADSPIGAVILDEQNLALDHNQYSRCDFIGKGRDKPMPSIFTWRGYTGFDRHSVALAVAFVGAEKGDYHAAEALPWAHDRAVTSGWGTNQCGSVAAPKSDIDGRAYAFGPCAGACETVIVPDRPADGEFTVAGGEGDVSVGLFTKTGVNIAYLVNQLPLAKGVYHYWLPSRDWKHEPMETGEYTLKVAESNLSLRFISSLGNTGTRPARSSYANDHASQVVFDHQNLPILALPWSESYQNYRGLDAGFENERWAVAGCRNFCGMSIDENNVCWALNDVSKDSLQLRRIDPATGRIEELSPGEYCVYIPKGEMKSPDGIAVSGGKIFLADPSTNTLYVSAANHPEFTKLATIPNVTKPIADPAHGLIWVICARNELLALAPSGAIQQRFKPGFSGIASFAINGARMAVLSRTTGKVHIYDCSDPANIKAVSTVGCGDGPYGPMQPDRFLFQRSEDEPGTADLYASVALDSAGRIAVCDRLGVQLFGADGKHLRSFTGIWAQQCEAGPLLADGRKLIIEKSYPMTMLWDPKTGKWNYHEWLKLPATVTQAKNPGQLMMVFYHEQTLYGVATVADRVHVLRFDKGIGSDVLVFKRGPKNVLQTLKGGNPEALDAWQPMTRADGQPIVLQAEIRSALIATTDGSLNFNGTRIKLLGFHDNGAPQYDWTHAICPGPWIARDGETLRTTFISPYDGKTPVDLRQLPTKWSDYLPDGGRTVNLQMNTKPLIEAGAHPGNSSGYVFFAGSDLAGIAPDGQLRWLRPLRAFTDPQGGRVVDGLTYLTSCPVQESIIIDQDGFQVGVCNVPKELWWDGMWLDNPWQSNVFKGADGKHYFLIGNFNDCVSWCCEVMGATEIKRSSAPVTIDDAKAATLAGLPPPALPQKKSFTQATLTIKKLPEPMPIDGSFAKWEAILPLPQIILTPEAAGSSFKGAKDCCGFVRLAYHGTDLYVQQVRFDDVVTNHQLPNAFYQQDCVEMAINSYRYGVKINSAQVHAADPDLLVRDGWFLPGLTLTRTQAPRSFKVMRATECPDRALMERITGEDLSACSVQVFEFKLPLEAWLFEKRDATVIPKVESGKTLRIGVLLDDNDVPGADIQRTLSWPATYRTSGPLECSALATFE